MTRTRHYLLDTDMCIYLLNGDRRVKNRVAQAGLEAISVSILTVGELYFGAYNSEKVEANLDRVRTFLSPRGQASYRLTMPLRSVSGGSKPSYAVVESL